MVLTIARNMKLVIAALALVACVFAEPAIPIRPRLDGRIVGGVVVDIAQYNWQVQLLMRGSHICGGTIIGTQWVVTAAHCTDGSTASSLSIRAGTSIRNSGGVVINVAQLSQNPSYNPQTIDYDISVLRLSSALTLGTNIGVATLPSDNQNIPTGTLVDISGWGTTSEGGSTSNNLRAVTVPTVSNQVCNDAYGSITARMMCAGVTDGGKDACQGDSGGPLVQGRQLLGIVSWGYGCARPGYPGVYASVPNLRSYIRQIAGI